MYFDILWIFIFWKPHFDWIYSNFQTKLLYCSTFFSRGWPKSNSMAFVTSQLETLGMIKQPVWLWYGKSATGKNKSIYLIT